MMLWMILRHLWQVEAEERDCDCQDGAEGFGKKGCGVSCLCVCTRWVCTALPQPPPWHTQGPEQQDFGSP